MKNNICLPRRACEKQEEMLSGSKYNVKIWLLMAHRVSYKQLIPGAGVLKANTQANTSQSDDTSPAHSETQTFHVNGDRFFSQT